MIISVASGKGGTGKTVLTASFAAIAKRVETKCDHYHRDLRRV